MMHSELTELCRLPVLPEEDANETITLDRDNEYTFAAQYMQAAGRKVSADDFHSGPSRRAETFAEPSPAYNIGDATTPGVDPDILIQDFKEATNSMYLMPRRAEILKEPSLAYNIGDAITPKVDLDILIQDFIETANSKYLMPRRAETFAEPSPAYNIRDAITPEVDPDTLIQMFGMGGSLWQRRGRDEEGYYFDEPNAEEGRDIYETELDL